MPVTIREYINANIERTIRDIAISSGYANDVTNVVWTDDLGSPQNFPDVTGVFVRLFDTCNDTRRDDSPIGKDDLDCTVQMQCYFLEADGSEVKIDKRNATILGDLRKALMVDAQRGTHPTNGSKLAINTNLGTPQAIVANEATGIEIPLIVWYRTSESDPYSQ